ncbi:aminoglycoside phosphotransferase family protein [Thalassotalea ganghwensis]
MPTDIRQEKLMTWLASIFPQQSITLSPLTGDAGFRRYYRFFVQDNSYIAVDTPIETCNNDAFIARRQELAMAHIKVPDLIAHQAQQGFFCLSDLGDCLLSDIISVDNVQILANKPIKTLSTLSQLETKNLPIYDRAFIEMELGIFTQWLLSKHLGVVMTEEECQQLKQCFELLTENALAQPTVFMHRDYHSRNLMVLGNEQLAVIDFQDAVRGPVTYDIVSLLRDCYVRYPDDKVTSLSLSYFNQIKDTMQLANITEQQWIMWFDLMGLQRHLKASGIFARLFHRDGKLGYLKDIPLTLSYIIEIASRYQSLQFLANFVENRVLPLVVEKAQPDTNS